MLDKLESFIEDTEKKLCKKYSVFQRQKLGQPFLVVTWAKCFSTYSR